jgi:hypothetical protein
MSHRGPQPCGNGPQGINAAEPYKEQPAPPQPQRPSSLFPGDTEFGFGPGLVAPCYNGKPPSQGGVYVPKAPPVHENGRQKPIPHGQARGYPGEQIAP